MKTLFNAVLGAGLTFALSACSTLETRELGSGVMLENFDKSVRPQDDFYHHVNGGWIKRTEIPADKSNYGAFTILDDEAQVHLRQIIEEAAAKEDKVAGSDEQKVGDLYASYLDEARVEELGLKPLEADLARIDGMKAKAEISKLMGELFRAGVDTPVNGYVNQDFKDPDTYLVYLFQSGLGMPDRDYYLEDNEKFKELRKAYQAHVQKMLEMAGDKDAANSAKAVMNLEVALAKKYWTKVDSRDRDKIYNKLDRAALNKLTPAFDWSAFMKEGGITSDHIILGQPSAIAGFSEQIEKQSLATWKSYFKMRLLTAAAPFLSKAFVDQDFAFNGKALRGTEELQPRWKRAVEAVEFSLGESLGKIYVARHFPPEAKRRMETLVRNLIKAYEASIKELDWMGPETKQKALEKLAKFTPKIGYPNKWKDYSSLSIVHGDLLGNMKRAAQFAHDFEMAKLGQPIDRDEWHLTPQTVNAYYNPSLNEIVFPAAILQPPFFNLEAEDAVNYGGIGAVIGHEIGHGFDDQGSKFDGDGKLQSWWTEADRKAFEDRTGKLIDQYNQYEPMPGHKVNGELTIGENIGDLGGATIAYKAYKMSLEGKEGPVIDGYTADQRFFIGYAQIWARKFRDNALLERLKSDPHAPPYTRCNGALVNVPEFAAAFGVKPGDAMHKEPKERIKIW